MRTELLHGIGPIQILAVLLHVGILVIIQQLLDRVARRLGVDRLSLVNDRSTKSAVIRALLTRVDLWIWACGLYMLLVWHFETFLYPFSGCYMQEKHPEHLAKTRVVVQPIPRLPSMPAQTSPAVPGCLAVVLNS